MTNEQQQSDVKVSPLLFTPMTIRGVTAKTASLSHPCVNMFPKTACRMIGI